jgi:DDE superfamily endonuclease
VLVVDESGDLKKGTATVGVARQYTGTAGKVENAQVAVYLTYVAAAGHAVIDRELYVPRGWIADPARPAGVGVPEQARFATKPELACRMLERALAAGVPAGCVTGDEVYGGNPALRGWLERHQMPYVLAIKCTERLCPVGRQAELAARLTARMPHERRLRISAGDGAKGKRWYAWMRMPLAEADAPAGWGHWLLVRRSLATGELAYRCAGPGHAVVARAGPGSRAAMEGRDVSTTVHSYMRTGCMIRAPVVGWWL